MARSTGRAQRRADGSQQLGPAPALSPPSGDAAGLTRRTLLQRGACAGLAATLAQLPAMLGAKGLLETALAQSPDLTTDTLNGLVAFLAPGNDAYSKHQGQSTNHPGAVGANVVQTFIYDLDHFVPVSALGSQGATLPASGGVAALLNLYATQVNPAAVGSFLSPFARLSFAEKAKAFQRFEADLQSQGTELSFVSGILPGFATFLIFSEAGALDPKRRVPRSRPVGWQLTKYAGPAEGWPELRGYYQGRHKVKGARRNATRRPR